LAATVVDDVDLLRAVMPHGDDNEASFVEFNGWPISYCTVVGIESGSNACVSLLLDSAVLDSDNLQWEWEDDLFYLAFPLAAYLGNTVAVKKLNSRLTKFVNDIDIGHEQEVEDMEHVMSMRPKAFAYAMVHHSDDEFNESASSMEMIADIGQDENYLDYSFSSKIARTIQPYYRFDDLIERFLIAILETCCESKTLHSKWLLHSTL